MREYKQMVIEWVNNEYQDYENNQEYENIMKNINNIIIDVYPKINDKLTLEEEMELVWSTIEKYK